MTDLGSPDATGNAAQVAYWNDKAGQTWTDFQERIDATFDALTAQAVAAASPQPGERVIDVGCGCGATVLQLARAVQPNGRVVGVDVSEPMAARARERVEQAGIDHAQIMVADASTHAFPDQEADLVFSRFGVMFFADPVAAFKNLAAATKPGGRLAFAAWRALIDNPWFAVPLSAASDLLPAQPPTDPTAPGPFAFADADRVRHILTEAGWHDVHADRHDASMRVAGPGQLAEATEFATRIGPLARALADVNLSTRQQAREVVAKALGAFDGPDGVVLPGSIWLLSARR